MSRKKSHGLILAASLVPLGTAVSSKHLPAGSPISIDPAKLARAGAVDGRFQSYNVEIAEVTGGNFWKPYGKRGQSAAQAPPSSPASGSTPAGMNPDLYQYRPPIDLAKPRLRKLAAALGPAYVRVSGTWANTVYFQGTDEPAPVAPPRGFSAVLTRPEWKGVVDFARAVDARIVTSFAFSPGTRSAEGAWMPDQARRLLDYTKACGGSIAAAEFVNEPTYAAMGGAPPGYNASDYGRDVAACRAFIKQASPDTIFLGPGSVGEGGANPLTLGSGMLHSVDLLQATGPAFDIFSYHLYAAASKRCASLGPGFQTTAAAALSNEWLSSADGIHAFYAGLRDRFEPGKPLWITETADAACGGNPWASTFLDSFRYLDWHGRLARSGVQVIMHNTLASSDYGLLDDNSYAPRPNYWAALLWRRLMGRVVLNAGPAQPELHLYAHSLEGHPGGVTLLAINTSRDRTESLALPLPADRYTLTARKLEDTHVQLNGHELKLGAGDAPPSLEGQHIPAGPVKLAPASITFLAIAEAGNPNSP